MIAASTSNAVYFFSSLAMDRDDAEAKKLRLRCLMADKSLNQRRQTEADLRPRMMAMFCVAVVDRLVR